MKISFGDVLLTGAAVIIGARLGIEIAVTSGAVEVAASDKNLKEKIKAKLREEENEEALNDYIEARDSYLKFKKECELNEDDLNL